MAIADALDDADLEPIGVHIHLDRLENELDAVLDTYETIGCRRLIVPSYDTDAFDSIEGARAAARRLTDLAVRIDDAGFELLYHNHAFEFAPSEDLTAYDEFADATGDDVRLELDTGLALFGGADPVDVLSCYADKIPMIHLTDSVPGREATIQVELGAGELDVDGCVETAREAGVHWLIYEHGQTSDPLDSLTHGATMLPTLIHGHRAPGTDFSSSVD